MDWRELARSAPPWVDPAGVTAGFPFAVCTRLFAYRNFAGEPFPVSASREALAAVAAKARGPLSDWGAPRSVRLSDCPAPVLRMLRERGLLADPSLPLRARKEFKLLALPAAPPPGTSSSAPRLAASRWAWVNEIEHLTLAHVAPGLLPDDGFARAFPPPVEEASPRPAEGERHPPWAWSPRHGYLVSDPARLGPGFASEILAHLPALALSRRLGYAHNAMLALGVAFLPVTRMETGERESAMFRFRSGGALGLSAEEAYRRFSGDVQLVLRWEAEAQKRLVEKHRKRLEERVEKSLHFLSETRSLTYPAFLAAASFVRLGAYAGILKPQIPTLLEELRTLAQSGHLQVSADRISGKEEEDIARANVVRLTLEKLRDR